MFLDFLVKRMYVLPATPPRVFAQTQILHTTSTIRVYEGSRASLVVVIGEVSAMEFGPQESHYDA